MVYLTAETRTRVGEKGINDPPVKLLITILTFFVLWCMSMYGALDPSLTAEQRARTNATVADPLDLHLPLPRVCAVQAWWRAGLMWFILVCCSCLGFVIFVTSKQTLSGLRALVQRRAPKPPPEPASKEAALRARLLDLILGQLLLFFIFFGVCVLIMLFFSFVNYLPYTVHADERPRRSAAWADACAANDEDALARFGLS